jgi:hypothetical protein
MIMTEERLEDRDWGWWLDYCAGATQTELARRDNVDQSTVSRALDRVRAAIPERDRAEEVQRSLAMLDRLRRGAMEIVAMTPAPVTVGKEGDLLYDPEVKDAEDRPVLVRDYTGRLRAMETALKMEARIGQILGYDAAQKLDMSVSHGEERAAESLAEDAARRLAGGTP